MPNYIPYLLLTIISITILTVTIVHKRQFGITVLFFCFAGMVYVAELFVMIIGNCYYYLPEVLTIGYYDHMLGAFVSNLFVIPTLCVVTSVYQLRFRWIVLFAVILVGVEWVFESIAIYHTYWWRKEFTFFALIIFFPFTKFWVRTLQLGTSWSRFLSLWMQGWSGAVTVMYIMSVIGIRHYEYGFFENVYRDDIFISGCMGIFKGFIFAVAIIFFKKLYWRILAPVLVYGVDLPLYALGVLIIEIPFWIYTSVYLVLAMLLLWWIHYAYSFICKLAR
ncbi:hypothetical protein [Aquibacillus rhizosphaerae]|uniref:Uncharacterized protein n=1 Tax=Aquibacillus rhizosphaerae TaxID=3051431 RepID=A0ABT7L2W9_9BACI|nr:hypothetical protein [Aquibacillus sp. LR5S19]MDL4840213.1 hypothetical protein [Aquibacillus sp. LR5S19]